MIFYTIKLDNKTVLDWAGTQAEAKQAVKDQRERLHPDLAITWHEEDVPTDKPSLLAWLKVNALGERKRKQTAEPLPPNP